MCNNNTVLAVQNAFILLWLLEIKVTEQAKVGKSPSHITPT